MKEELAVLDFFAQTENLPLGLAVAEQMDALRDQMNNRLWRELQSRFNALVNEYELAWQVHATEDKNTADNVVGLHCTTSPEQALYLKPMLEQQYLGGVWRIYFGLMWSTTPATDQLKLSAVSNLKAALQQSGFKNNTNFLGWQWTPFHPRRKDFLLRYAQQPEKLLDEIEAVFKTLLIEHRAAIALANATLKSAPQSLAASLDQLRDQLID